MTTRFGSDRAEPMSIATPVATLLGPERYDGKMPEERVSGSGGLHEASDWRTLGNVDGVSRAARPDRRRRPRIPPARSAQAEPDEARPGGDHGGGAEEQE